MCLDSFKRVKPTDDVVVGWKVFTSGLWAPYRPSGRYNPFPTNKWLRSKSGPGFHVFVSRSSALNWRGLGEIVRRVKVRFVTRKGPQCGMPAFVAKEIFIPSRKRKPAKTAKKGKTPCRKK